MGKEGNIIRLYSDLFRFTDIQQPIVPDEYTKGSNSAFINKTNNKKEDKNNIKKAEEENSKDKKTFEINKEEGLEVQDNQ